MRRTSESDYLYTSVISCLLITCWIKRALRAI